MKKWQKISWYWFEEIIIKDSKVQSTMNLKKEMSMNWKYIERYWYSPKRGEWIEIKEKKDCIRMSTGRIIVQKKAMHFIKGTCR